MNMEIGTEAVQFPEKEYIKWDFRCNVPSLKKKIEGNAMQRVGRSPGDPSAAVPGAGWPYCRAQAGGDPGTDIIQIILIF